MHVNHWIASHNFLNFVVLLCNFTEVVFEPLLGLHTFFYTLSPSPPCNTHQKKPRNTKKKVKDKSQQSFKSR